MSQGLQTLREAVALLLAEKPGNDRKLAALLDPTRPLTAEEMCERWDITSESEAGQLELLNKRAVRWGLRPLAGTRGWDALYSREDVLHAEAMAAGKLTRRKHA